MDENEQSKSPSIPETAGDPASPALPPGSPAETGEPAIAAKAELDSIESPPLAPTMSDMAAERPGRWRRRRSGPRPRRKSMR